MPNRKSRTGSKRKQTLELWLNLIEMQFILTN
jgi:hypothetical protein